MRADRGFTLIELLIAVAVIGILAAIAIPNMMGAHRRSQYSRAVTDTKIATTQAIVYGNDNGRYPGSVTSLRDAGYAAVGNNDPWGNPYQLAPTLIAQQVPGLLDDIYVYSKGATNTGTYPVPFVANTGPNGSAGYSSVYGSWSGT